jgi:hypothetical protein
VVPLVREVYFMEKKQDVGPSIDEKHGPLVKLIVTMGQAPTGGIYVALAATTVHGTRTLATWYTHGRGINSGELEDIQGDVCQAITDHLTINSGVQLTLHDG